MDQPPAMVKQVLQQHTVHNRHLCRVAETPPARFLFQNHSRATGSFQVALFQGILFDCWWALTILWWKTFTKWRKLSSCWHNCAVLLTKVVQTGPVSEMRLHSMSALSFLTDNTPTPMAVLLCLVPTSDLLACIYSLHFSFENNHTTVVFSLFTAFPIQFQ